MNTGDPMEFENWACRSPRDYWRCRFLGHKYAYQGETAKGTAGEFGVAKCARAGCNSAIMFRPPLDEMLDRGDA